MNRLFVPALVALCCLAFPDAASASATCPTSGQAGQVPAAKLVTTSFDASVTASYCGSVAGYTSDLYLVSPDTVYIATGHVTPAGNTVDLGAVLAGDELVFSIYVRNTGYTYYSGPGSRNPDGLVHAAVTDLGGGAYAVGFEDLYGGGDRDYDDIMFVVNANASIVDDDGTDTDGDGVDDYDDNCIDTPNADQADGDGDGIGDACDTCPDDASNTCDICSDGDGDGFCDEDDNCDAVSNDQTDADEDDIGDACDACPDDADNDADADGLCADEDNCASVANADQADADEDELGDACDACPIDPLNDADADGACADEDNCPEDTNADQADADDDLAGDACDVCPLDAEDDADNDGYCADEDSCPELANDAQTDSDADGAGDACDTCPYDADDDADADGVCGDVDACADTVLPDDAPTVRLGTNRWADVNGDGVFDTVSPNGRGPGRSYTIEETSGCSCAQIVDALDLGEGHLKHGCSISAMDEWTAIVGDTSTSR